jgi:hypothetical protein
VWLISQQVGDPMLVHSVSGLRELHARIQGFLESPDRSLALAAVLDSDPHYRFLPGLRLTKSPGTPHLSSGDDLWLELAARPDELMRFNKVVLVEDDGDHQHWHCSPVSLIVEADDAWVEEHEG